MSVVWGQSCKELSEIEGTILVLRWTNGDPKQCHPGLEDVHRPM